LRRRGAIWPARCISIDAHSGDRTVILTIWLPGLFLLGLFALALMAVFVNGCDRI
jgi:hypothetical protein